MAKTLKQIADEIGISKQRVYRFVKQEGIIGTHQENQTIYYDEQAEQTIKVAFQFEPHHEAVSDAVAQSMEHNQQIIEMLQTTVAIMQKQIEFYQTELQKRDEQLEKRDNLIEQLRHWMKNDITIMKYLIS